MIREYLVAACLALLPVGARAQTARNPDATPPAPRPPDVIAALPAGAADESIDPTKLGISFDRVRMELAHPAPARANALKITETVEVVGKAPALQLWNPKTADLTSAAVPFGAPTQKDIMKLIVPKEFQTYPMDLNALMAWLMEHLNNKKSAE